MAASDESRGMGISYERIDDESESSFVDPFSTAVDYEDVRMTREDYGLTSSGGVAYDAPLPSSSAGATASSSSKGSGGSRGSSGSSSGSGSSHLSSNDLAAAMHSGSLAMNAFAGASAALGGGGGDSGGTRYLAHERRSLWGQASYNIGYSYFGGLAVGGAWGLAAGLRAAPHSNARVLLNSALNGSGKHGARCGNAAGVLALLYTCAWWGVGGWGGGVCERVVITPSASPPPLHSLGAAV